MCSGACVRRRSSRTSAAIAWCRSRRARALAAGIPGARFLPLDGRNHVALADEPAWRRFIEAVRAFVGRPDPEPAAAEELSPRELEVVRLAAAGLTNDEIAARLVLSVRTVERHLSNVYAKLRLSGKSARAAAVARVVLRD
jgi:DNA-binding NarL/FixJ family response regulator